MFFSFAITRKTISGIGFLDTKQLLKSNTSTFAIIGSDMAALKI
jgi:hypothetical protein